MNLKKKVEINPISGQMLNFYAHYEVSYLAAIAANDTHFGPVLVSQISTL